MSSNLFVNSDSDLNKFRLSALVPSADNLNSNDAGNNNPLASEEVKHEDEDVNGDEIGSGLDVDVELSG